MNNKIKVSIVILNYNSWNVTINAIKNIEEIIVYDNLNVLIVDNCSSNDAYERIDNYLKSSKLYGKYKLVGNKKNTGYAAGNNIGLRLSIEEGASYSLVINNDILFTDPHSIEKMVDYLESNATIGAISPRIVSPDGFHDKPIYYRKPSFWDLSFGIKKYVNNIKLQNDELVYEVYAPRGSCMMVRNDALAKIGLLDECTFLYYEEPILSESLLSIGKKCVNFGYVSIIHNHAVTIKENVSRSKNRDYVVQSMDYYLKKYRHFNWIERTICSLIRKYAYLFSHK